MATSEEPDYSGIDYSSGDLSKIQIAPVTFDPSPGYTIDSGGIVNTPGIAAGSGPSTDPNSIGGILNGLGGFFNGVAKVIQTSNSTPGAIPRPLYNPRPATPLGLGNLGGGGGGLVMLALVGAVGYFLLVRK